MKRALEKKVTDKWYNGTSNNEANCINYENIVLKNSFEEYNKDIDLNSYNFAISREMIESAELNNIKESIIMDNNDNLFIQLINNIQESNKDIKIDLIESEKRIHQERLELENRLNEHTKLSEERMEKRFNETMKSINELNTKIDGKIERIEDKIDGTNKWIVGTCIATILAIAGMVVTVIYSVFSMLPKK